MTILTSSVSLWLNLALVASPWDPPLCSDPSAGYADQGSPLGGFGAAFLELKLASDELARSLRAGSSDPEAAARVEDSLDRLRFHPREVALEPQADERIGKAIAILAAHAQAEDKERGQDSGADRAWARLGLSRHGLDPAEVHELGAKVELLYSNTTKDLRGLDTGMIRVNCDSSCVAFVDGAPISLVDGYAEVDLIPGTHDVWVFDADRPDQGTFEVIELDPREQRCVIFSVVGSALPTRAQWWAASEFADRLGWALSCKSNATGTTPETLAGVVDGWPAHTLVLSRERWLRHLLVRALLNLADLHVVSAQGPTPAPTPDPAGTSRDAGPVAAPTPGVKSPPADAIDMALQIGRFDEGVSVNKLAAPLAPLRPLFVQRDGAAAERSAEITITCYESCWPTIMGVRVREGSHAVAPGRYFVELHGTNTSEDPRGTWVTVEAGAVESVVFGRLPAPPPVIAPVDLDEPAFDHEQQYRRLAFGTAGAISLTAGAFWSLAIAAGMIPNHKIIAVENGTIYVLSPEQRLRVGLYMSGAFSLHALLATYMFVRMPPSQKVGAPLIAAGGGLLASSAFLTGIGIAGGVAARKSQNSLDELRVTDCSDSPCADPETLEARLNSSIHTIIAGASIGGALLLGGSVVLGVGLRRAKRAASPSSAGVKAQPKLSELSLAPALGRELLGLRLSGKF